MKVTCPKCKRRVRIRRGENRPCTCGHNLNYRHFFHKVVDYDVYLVDANIFIYAINKDPARGGSCRKVLGFSSERIKIGTTDKVMDEVNEPVSQLDIVDIKVYKTGKINEKLKDLKTNQLKQPSETDLSLIQAAIEHPEVKGLITYDKDFANIATSGMVENRSVRKFWLGNARDFLGKYEIKTKVGKKL